MKFLENHKTFDFLLSKNIENNHTSFSFVDLEVTLYNRINYIVISAVHQFLIITYSTPVL